MESVIRFFSGYDSKSYFIFGPRGTGKSTWAHQAYPDAEYIDLLAPDLYRAYQASPARLRERVLGSTQHTFVIDEIQKAPALLSLIHALIEEDKRRQFILTGSSARKLKREGVDLLAGRALLTHMHPFMAAELGSDFSLTRALHHGMLPLVWGSQTPAADLNTYLALYMKEEVQMEGLVRQIDAFGLFLEAISFSQGAMLSYANIARDCHVSSKSVENYVGILEDLLLCFRLPVFNKKAKRHLMVKSKFYYFDAGVYRSIRPKGVLDVPDEINGITLETLVAQHIRAWLAYSHQAGQLYYWRTKGGLEVDFIVYGEITFHAIEVKNAKSLHPKDLTSLKAFKLDYPQANCLLLYRGTEVLQKQGVLCYPVDVFLSSLRPNCAMPGSERS